MPDEIDLAAVEYGGIVYTAPIEELSTDMESSATRLLKAMLRGEATKGGMAEAGWRVLGHLDANGITLKPGGPHADQAGE
jgi:hypothetical protein